MKKFCGACWFTILFVLAVLLTGPRVSWASDFIARTATPGMPKTLKLKFYTQPLERTATFDPLNLEDFTIQSCPLGLATYTGAKRFLRFDTGEVYALSATVDLYQSHALFSDECPLKSLANAREVRLVFNRADQANGRPRMIEVRVRFKMKSAIVEEILADDFLTIARGSLVETY